MKWNAATEKKTAKGEKRNTPTHPPLNRPSVIQATSSPRPAPMMSDVGLSISGIPRNIN